MATNWGKGAQGALGGAATGATLGSVVPGIGTAVGALGGAAVGGLSGLFGGDDTKQISTFDPRQKQLYDQYTQALQGGGGPLADIYGQYNPQAMQDYYQKSIAQPAYQNFQENIVPGITGQFRGANLQNSSYLGGALSKAGTDVQNNLSGQMAELLFRGQESQQQRRAGALNSILGLQTHVNERQGPSVFDNLLGSLSEGAGDLLGQYLKSRKTGGSSQGGQTPNQITQTPQSFQAPQTIGG